MLHKEFPPAFAWFADLTVRLDLGFQGFADLYPCKHLHIPYKRRRTRKQVSNELTREQKEYNQQSSKERIFVEHAIGGMKRYRILEHRNRLKSSCTIDQVIGVCAALWNFSLDNWLIPNLHQVYYNWLRYVKLILDFYLVPDEQNK